MPRAGLVLVLIAFGACGGERAATHVDGAEGPQHASGAGTSALGENMQAAPGSTASGVSNHDGGAAGKSGTSGGANGGGGSSGDGAAATSSDGVGARGAGVDAAVAGGDAAADSIGRPGKVPEAGGYCVVSNTLAPLYPDVEQLDLLFVIDDSAAMGEEQGMLRDQLPRLLRALGSGDRDGDGSPDQPEAKDVHVGVVSSDMGALGRDGVAGCDGFGDDGLLLHAAGASMTGCRASYPPFLSFAPGAGDVSTAATDLACISALGGSGCGFRQPLEAGLKALWPASDNRISFLGDSPGMHTTGHGDRENSGFLRAELANRASVLAIVVVSDGDDCSSLDTSHFEPAPALGGDPQVLQDANLRCQRNESNLYALERYVNGYRALREDRQELVIFAAIAGVPADLLSLTSSFDWSDDDARLQFYLHALDDPRMRAVPDAQGTSLLPSCVSAHGNPFPPRRLVQTASGFGRNGWIGSLCGDDLAPALDGLLARIGDQLGPVCFRRPLTRGSDGLVGCKVYWELPPSAQATPGTPSACGVQGFEFLTTPPAGEPALGERGGARCVVAQLPVHGAAAPSGSAQGWYYDDFSATVQRDCPTAERQRIAFTSGARIPIGATAELACVDQQPSLIDVRPQLTTETVARPLLGDLCDGDAACYLQLKQSTPEWPDGSDRRMFCHPVTRRCTLSCSSSLPCPESFACDETDEAKALNAGHGVCVAQSCSAGPASAVAIAVGTPCLPYSVPADGFGGHDVYIETSTPQCSGGVCLVNHLLGDARGNCIPRPDAATVCADSEQLPARVFCSCRCDAPEGFATCGCPAGFHCADVLPQGNENVRGGYCVRDGT